MNAFLADHDVPPQATAPSLTRNAAAEPALRLPNSVIHPADQERVDQVAYGFGPAETAALVARRRGVIVHHGDPVPAPGYSAVYSHSETLALFVNREVAGDALAPDAVRRVLAGDVRSWGELRGTDVDVRVYAAEGDLPRRALAYQLARARAPLGAPVRRRGSYEVLARMLRSDPGAIVLGLRSGAAHPSRLPGAARLQPQDGHGSPMFDVPIVLYVQRARREARRQARALLELVAVRAAEDGASYPLDERLAALEH